MRPNKGYRSVELQHQTDTKDTGQQQSEARKPTGGTSPVLATARTRQVLHGQRDRSDRVLVSGHERRPRTFGNELEVVFIKK